MHHSGRRFQGCVHDVLSSGLVDLERLVTEFFTDVNVGRGVDDRVTLANASGQQIAAAQVTRDAVAIEAFER